tara:strand:+ start:912 stop:1016 length:105 start_codon:yes stop_codon:yes gene_type:complete
LIVFPNSSIPPHATPKELKEETTGVVFEIAVLPN